MDYERYQIIPNAAKVRRAFLKGPIPLDWLSRAASLPGRSLHVALAIQHMAALQKATTFKMRRGIREVFCISRDAFARGLHRLETARLVSVERGLGRSALITILELSSEACPQFQQRKEEEK